MLFKKVRFENQHPILLSNGLNNPSINGNLKWSMRSRTSFLFICNNTFKYATFILNGKVLLK